MMNNIVPVKRRFVDLSVPLENEVIADPPGAGPKIKYSGHTDAANTICRFFPELVPEDLPDGEGWAIEQINLSTHNGTHLDAPWHFASTMNRGEPAWTIDQVPLEWCFQPGVKFDFRHFPDGYVVTGQDIETELKRIQHTLSPQEIVLINTAAGARYGKPDYVCAGCGMGREATLYLTSRGVRVTGTDGWSWDAPFFHTAKRYAQTGNSALIWEGHKAGREVSYTHIEKLHNLELLPDSGFLVSCFPVKIKGASAGWSRVVAIFEDPVE
jgi:kynurenine formamidase